MNEMGMCPMCLATFGKFWIGECNLDLKPKRFIPSPPKCRLWGHLGPGVGWEGEGEMDLLEQTQHPGKCVEDHRLAASTLLLVD